MGNANSLCLSIKDYEKQPSSKTPAKFISASLIDETNRLSSESFKMSSEDLKLSHQDFRRFLLSKLKKKCVENEEFLEYYEFYKIVTKDRVAFESIYWLFSIRWIEFIQANNNASRGRMNETAVSMASLQNFERDGGKMSSNSFMRFFVDEILSNNYKITQILEKFRTTFFKINQKYLQLDPNILESIDEKSLDLLNKKLIYELEHFLIDPLKDLIVFFYSSALEKIVFSLLGQDFQYLNLFILDIIHHLTFKSQNRIYNVFSNLLNLAAKKDALLFQENIKKTDFSLVSLLEGQECFISNEILMKVEDMNIFENACSKVRSISDARTPLMKLEIISQIQNEIFNALAQISEIFNLDFDSNKMKGCLDADQMLSLYCYVLVKSKHFEICREIKFIEKFIEDKIMEETQWGCLYETLRSSLKYILSLEDNN